MLTSGQDTFHLPHKEVEEALGHRGEQREEWGEREKRGEGGKKGEGKGGGEGEGGFEGGSSGLRKGAELHW